MRGRSIARLLLIWAGAFVTVVVTFAVLGQQLDALPLLLRALIVSGVLTVVMTLLVVPWAMRLIPPRR